MGVQTGLMGPDIYFFQFRNPYFISEKADRDLNHDTYLRILASGVFVTMTAGTMIPVWAFLLPLIYTWSLIGIA